MHWTVNRVKFVRSQALENIRNNQVENHSFFNASNRKIIQYIYTSP
jgi:tRNA/tmRNA/rRNA uracil-C5-methylase (TrmA/RlmC/RlmD family)